MLDDDTLITMRQWAYERMALTPPDEIIGDRSDPYMHRWYLTPRGLPSGNNYLHLILRSDDDRALHDHPWDWETVILDGGYYEHLPRIVHDDAKSINRWERRPGEVIRRHAARLHRLELIDDKPALTIFRTGPKYREWGFMTPQGWKHWQAFPG